ncbi:putative ribosomal protein L50, mitochondria [Septoria linicola]|nr:putative ribosomal protein L50, mitochondria [Septoria linicola]
MRHIRIAEQALRASAEPSSQHYVCRSCLAHATRQLHTTSGRRAEVPFYKKMTNMLFGDKKADNSKQRSREGSARTSKAKAGVEITTPTIRPLGKRKINGSLYETARRYDPTTEKYYLPSSTWDGLERVGGEKWAKKRLDMGEQYTGFLRKQKVELNNRQWQRLLHNAAIEVVALRQAGRSVYEVCNAHSGENFLGRTAKARLSQELDGTIRVHFASPEDQSAVLEGITATGTNVESSVVGPEELNQIEASVIEVDWVDVKLQDPEIKLAILKRAMQLSGKRLPDIQMNNASTLSDLYEAFKVKEKSKRLHEAPQVEQLAQTLPNVTVHKSRRTPVHKERQIGRWKVIEEELEMRDLPIFGSRWVNGKEGQRLLEK